MNDFKFLDLVQEVSGNPNGYVPIGVIVAGPLEIPYFHSGTASYYASKPLDIADPKEWEQTFTAYIVYDLVKNDYSIINKSHLDPITDAEAVKLFDYGTGNLRSVLGLIKKAEQMHGERAPNFLEKILK